MEQMMNNSKAEQILKLNKSWSEESRWSGIRREYTAADVVKLRGSIQIEHTLAKIGAQKLWRLLHNEHHVIALGAMNGSQAVQMVKSGLKSIYLSGWQVAAD